MQPVTARANLLRLAEVAHEEQHQVPGMRSRLRSTHTGLPHQQVSPVSEELRAGEDTRCTARALRTERIERVEWPAVNKQRGEGMDRNAFYASECSEAVVKYRSQAVKHRNCSILRRCYLELAWKNRRQAREYALLAA